MAKTGPKPILTSETIISMSAQAEMIARDAKAVELTETDRWRLREIQQRIEQTLLIPPRP